MDKSTIYRAPGIFIPPGAAVTITGWSELVATNLICTAMILTPGGSLVTFQIDINTPATGSGSSKTTGIPEGRCVQCILRTPTTGVSRGVLFGRVTLLSGQGEGAVELGVLVSGYPTSNSVAGVPLGKLEHSNIADGALNRITLPGGTGAAGISYGTISQAWRPLEGIALTMVADANAANRRIIITATYGGPAEWVVRSRADQTAGQTVSYYCLADGFERTNYTGVQYIPIPRIDIGRGFEMQISIEGGQVGDEISDGFLFGRAAIDV